MRNRQSGDSGVGLTQTVARHGEVLGKQASDIASLTRDMDQLTSNVLSLANTVKEQGTHIFERMEHNAEVVHGKLESLAIAVTQASAPRRTDWVAIAGVGTLVLMVVLSCGTAAMSPLFVHTNYTHDAIVALELKSEKFALREDLKVLADNFSLHERLQGHPVLLARVEALERDFAIIQRDGTPVTASRIAVLESEVKSFSELAKELRASELRASELRASELRASDFQPKPK